MRKLSILACFILLTSPLAITQANGAVPKLGGTCSKVGIFGDTPSIRFICVKSGKKLVWKKWTPPTPKGATTSSGTPATTQASSTTPTTTSSGASAPTKAPSPTVPTVLQIAGSSCMTAGEWKTDGEMRYYCEGTNRRGGFLWDKGTPTSFIAPMPIKLPVAQNGTITFANALSHISEIPNVSYQRIQNIIDASPAVDVPHQLLVGPNTTTVTKTLEENILSREFKLWGGFQQTHYLTVIAYNHSDMSWAAATNDALILSKGYPVNGNPNGKDRAQQSCHTATDCAAGNAGQVIGADDAIEFLGVTTDGQWDPTQNGEVGHEYTHTVTSAQFIGTAAVNQNYYEQMFMPCWMNEGLSNASGIGASSTTLRQYLDNRDGNVTRFSVLPSDFKGFSAAGLKDFLTTQISSQSVANSCYGGPAYPLGYSIGYAATEALFAIGGPQSVMALVSRAAMGDNFSQAFQNVYGISWDEGSTILGQILAAEYAVKPLKTSN